MRSVMRPLRDEAGLILPLTLMALVVLATLAAALVTIGGSEVQIAANHFRATQAYFLAEAGLEDAFNVFRTTPSLVSSAPAALTPVPGLNGPGTALAPYGSYTVQYQRAGLDTAHVIATGTTASGSALRVLTATLGTTFHSDDALRTRQDLIISGNTNIVGRCGSVHSNGDLTLSGGAVIEGNATASGAYTASGNATVGQDSGGGRPVKLIPAITPSDFLAAAKGRLPANEIFQLKADGLILDGNDTVIASVSPGEEYRGWKYLAGAPVIWELSSNTGHDGTYYLEGSAKIGGNPGTEEEPWRTSIIATGDIDISGNPAIVTHLSDVLFVAGLDIKVGGNQRRGFRGLFAAHEQIDISGNANITGLLIAEGATNIGETATANSLSGNPTITYDCVLNPGLAGPPSILAWGP